jgi:hypothetical protein
VCMLKTAIFSDTLCGLMLLVRPKPANAFCVREPGRPPWTRQRQVATRKTQ